MLLKQPNKAADIYGQLKARRGAVKLKQSKGLVS